MEDAKKKSREEFNALYEANTKMSGFGLGNVAVHSPCPFCAAPEFLTYLVHEVQPAMEKGATCKACGRGMRALFDRTVNGVQFEIVQTCGAAPPDFLHPIRRLDAVKVEVEINGVTKVIPRIATFDDVVKAAALTGSPSITVKPLVGEGFSLTPGQSREFSKGTRINAVHTGAA